MTAAQAKEPGKSKAEASGQKAKPLPASAKAAVFNSRWRQLALGVQAKLVVSSPDDPCEREADEVAERVMRMAEPRVQHKCTTCEEEEKRLPKENRSTPDATATVPPAVRRTLTTAGQPLDSATREHFEPRFGRDFGSVRIHADHRASEAARGVAAQAFTVGRDIVFARGHYAPETERGRQLLAHELTHVVQQSGEPRQRTRKPAKEGSATGGAQSGGQEGHLSFLSAAHEFTHLSRPAQPGLIQRQPVVGGTDADDEEAADEPAPMPRPSLLSLDYSGPQACGGQPCFTDEMIYHTPDAVGQELVEPTTAQLPPPIGEIGQYQVSVGPMLSEEQRRTQPSPAGAAAVATPSQLPPQPGPQRVVLGGNDAVSGRAAASMSKQTGQPIVGLREGTLVGANEISLVAHGNEDVVRVGNTRLPPRELATRLVEAGWRGGTVRLVSCDTAVVGGPAPYGQQLANELAALGADSAVIAPKGGAYVEPGLGGLPRVLPPGATPIPANLRRLGRGWGYFVPEVEAGAAPPPGEAALPFLHPGTWSGAGWGAAKMVALIALSYIHNRAVARRVAEEREKTGFADWGPTGNRLYDFGAWILDPTDEAGRSISLCQRFDLPLWRRNLARKLLAHPVGEKLRLSWTTSGKPDPTFGNPTYRKFIGIYVKRPDGSWSTWGSKDTEGDDFPPDLNVIIDPLVSDEELRSYLELPSSCSADTGGLA